ncbi:hypothetical protein B0H14DRAFT_3859034 [Mycena olivaceomarginata]|nr:hypothetical protein B0H14DRAFT_3859034 [Mycena olivaceomarginata]
MVRWPSPDSEVPDIDEDGTHYFCPNCDECPVCHSPQKAREPPAYAPPPQPARFASLSPFRSSSFSSKDSSLADGDNSSSPISSAFCSVVSKISGGAFLVITDALELLSYYFPILPSPPRPCP